MVFCGIIVVEILPLSSRTSKEPPIKGGFLLQPMVQFFAYWGLVVFTARLLCCIIKRGTAVGVN